MRPIILFIFALVSLTSSETLFAFTLDDVRAAKAKLLEALSRIDPKVSQYIAVGISSKGLEVRLQKTPPEGLYLPRAIDGVPVNCICTGFVDPIPSLVWDESIARQAAQYFQKKLEQEGVSAKVKIIVTPQYDYFQRRRIKVFETFVIPGAGERPDILKHSGFWFQHQFFPLLVKGSNRCSWYLKQFAKAKVIDL